MAGNGMIALPGMGGVDLARVVFNRHDTDRSGTLDKPEFRELCYDLGYHLTEQEMDLAVQYLDLNGDGVLDFDEFKKWWNHKNRGERLHLEDKELENRLVASECFQSFDLNNKGVIEKDEFTLFYYHLVRKGIINENEFSQKDFVEELDPKSEGQINFRSYIDFLAQYQKSSPPAPSSDSVLSLENLTKKFNSSFAISAASAQNLGSVAEMPTQIEEEDQTKEPAVPEEDEPVPEVAGEGDGKPEPVDYPSKLDDSAIVFIKKNEKTHLTAAKTHHTAMDKLFKQQSKDEDEQRKLHSNNVLQKQGALVKQEKADLRVFTKDQATRKKEMKKAKLPMTDEQIKQEYDEFAAKIHIEQEKALEELRLVNLKQYYDLCALQIKARREADIQGYKTFFATQTRLLSEQHALSQADLKKHHDADTKVESKSIDKTLKEQEKTRKKAKDPMSKAEVEEAKAKHMTEVAAKHAKEVEDSFATMKEEENVLEKEHQSKLSQLEAFYEYKAYDNENRRSNSN